MTYGTAIFRRGRPIMADYTPADGNVNAGDIVALGDGLTGIAHVDLENNRPGALAVGGGIYDMIVEDNFAAGTPVFFDDGDIVDTGDGGNNRSFGFMVQDAPDNTTRTEVLHWPR